MLNNPKCRDKPLFITRKYPSINTYKIGFNLLSINTNVISYTPIHLARHTFATISLRNHVPIESISKMLGHSDIQTTQIYAKMLDEAVSEDMQKMRSKFDQLDSTVTPLKEKPTDFVREPPKKRGRPRKNPIQ